MELLTQLLQALWAQDFETPGKSVDDWHVVFCLVCHFVP